MNANTFVWDQRGYALIYGFTREQLWDFSGAYFANQWQGFFDVWLEKS